MTLIVQDATGTKQNMSTTTDASGNLVGSSCVTDPISGAKQTVSQLHAADQQSVPTTAYSGFSTGVAQLQDGVSGVVNRQREVGQDNVAPLGVSAGASNFAMQFKTTCSQNLSSSSSTMTLAAVSGTIGGVPWKIQQGTKLVIDTGAAQETLTVASISGNAVTFAGATVNAHNGSSTPFSVVGMTFNQERDASGENDGASGSGTAVAAEYEFNGGDPSGGNFDRARSINAKGLTTQTISAGGGQGSTSLTVGAATGLQPGMKVMLYNASFPAAGSYEVVNVDLSYTPGSTTVKLASATQNATTYTTLAYDAFSALGPQLNGFLPFGVGVETLALFDPVTGKMFGVRTNPGAPGVVAVSADGAKATYRYAGTFTPAATPTDMIVITGSASKTGRVKRIALGGIATTAGSMPVTLIRRSVINTGGTSAAVTSGGKHDVNDATATVIPAIYSANASGLGTSAGNLGQGRLWLPLSTGQPFPLVWDFSTRQDKALILRGTTDFIAINGNGATVPAGGAIDYEIEIEEDNS
jgi:hypothetical protein